MPVGLTSGEAKKRKDVGIRDQSRNNKQDKTTRSTSIAGCLAATGANKLQRALKRNC